MSQSKKHKYANTPVEHCGTLLETDEEICHALFNLKGASAMSRPGEPSPFDRPRAPRWPF
jgi:hypothetical protein